MSFSLQIIDPIELIGWAASLATIASYGMKTMIPLRILAICSSLLFLAYGLVQQVWPMVFMEAVLLPFNLWRLAEILILRRRLLAAKGADRADFSALKSVTRAERLGAGEMLFRQGERPDKVYLIAAGTVELPELGLRLGPGDIVGEIAFFTEAATRSASARCLTDCTIHAAGEDAFLKLSFQDPGFGLAVMRTITRRLAENAAHPAAAAVST
ncbi:cyclic nucleotide-binding domain-containing protein [Poseidonocella sp. HB161398]|uniref:cyclic nucleotide-binding domain-containing protein n=1 Tax=Poseidonocella sp. HB161398 TaxID=2320855 RepID=UPI0011090698|nr:cyclic nucleotide-binding domain-containing protein [Poseidonocella sp. HB161398]